MINFEDRWQGVGEKKKKKIMFTTGLESKIQF